MEMNDQVKVLNEDYNPTISLNNDTYFAVSLLKDTIVDDKELSKFIKTVERMVRSSPEYSALIRYMKEELNLNFCTYLNNLNTESVAIELHHTPYNLYQIIEIIILKNEDLRQSYNSFSIAMEVIKLHYQNYIGLVSLSKSIHELVHSEERFHIHKDLVIGNVDSFYELYKDYMTEDLRQVYRSWKKYSDENPADNLNTLELFDNSKREEQLQDLSDINKRYSVPLKNNNKNSIENQNNEIPELEF